MELTHDNQPVYQRALDHASSDEKGLDKHLVSGDAN